MSDIVVPDSKLGELKILDSATATCFNIFNILTISPTKFYVRGVEVPQDENEALAVYNAFCEAIRYKSVTNKEEENNDQETTLKTISN